MCRFLLKFYNFMKTKTQTMSKKVPYLIGILVTILLGTWLYMIFCCCTCDKKNTEKPITTINNTIEEVQKNTLDGFGFKNSEVNYYCNDNFNFGNPNYNLLLPVSDSINLGIEKLKIELEKPNSKFNITGLYSTSETNTSIFPDLGIARANAIKNYLVSKGIPENKLALNSELMSSLVVKTDTVFKAGRFNLTNTETSTRTNSQNSSDWNTAKQEINANPLILYFNTGQADIQLSEVEKAKVAKLVDYLNNVEGSKLSIIGYTDNTPGVRNTNQFYSEERAKFAKSYFVKNGISESKIETLGKGPINPIADNTTDEGKAKNRRAEVRIK